MKQLLNRARIVHLHRLIAIFAVIFILFVAISGLLLQHAKDFGWHKQTISQSWLLDHYGVPGYQPIGWSVVNRSKWQAIQLGDQIYINDTLIEAEGRLIGAIFIEPLLIVATAKQLYLFDDSLNPIEQITTSFSPAPLLAVGISDQRLFVQTQGQFYQADGDLIEFKKITEPAQKSLSSVEPLLRENAEVLPERVSDITLLRLMQDLHGGRLWGLPEWLIPDLTAFFLIFLSLSGLLMKWQRRPRVKTRHHVRHPGRKTS